MANLATNLVRNPITNAYSSIQSYEYDRSPIAGGVTGTDAPVHPTRPGERPIFYDDQYALAEKYAPTIRALGLESALPGLRYGLKREALLRDGRNLYQQIEKPFSAEVSAPRRETLARGLATRGFGATSSLYQKMLKDAVLAELEDFSEEEKQRLRQYINPETGTLYGVTGQRYYTYTRPGYLPGSVQHVGEERPEYYYRVGTQEAPRSTSTRETELERIRRLYNMM
jgi:hypothetical protein